MKKTIRFISFVLIAAMLFCMIPFSTSAASVLDGKKILFFGDSLTELGGSSRYSNLVASAFPNSTIINKGYRGDSTYQARLRFDTDVIAQDPDIVFICFGMNDQAIQTDGTPVKAKDLYRRNIANFIVALQNIGCDVVLMTPSPVCSASYYTRNPDYKSGDLAGYCDILRDLAVQYNCGLVDMNTVFTQNGYVTSTYIGDGLHQTAKGHKVYADNISAYLNAAYNNVNKATLTVNCVDENGNKVKSYNYVGAVGADIKITLPYITGYEPISGPVTTTLSTKAVELTYTYVWEDVIAELDAMNKDEYGGNVLKEIEHYRNFGEASTSLGDKEFAAGKIRYLLTVKGDETLVYSTNLAYTASPEPNYFYGGNDYRFVDDGVRLSDGSKSSSDGTNYYKKCYSVWADTDFEITFNFYHEIVVDTIRGYFAAGQMGIAAPEGMKISVSDDGVNFKEIDSTLNTQLVSSDEWNKYCYTLSCEPTKTRCVKITVIGNSNAAKYTWVDEVEVALSDTNALIEKYILGDVNDSGAVDMFDYILLKSACLGKSTLNERQSLAADMNDDGVINMFDYIALKKSCLDKK
ncbi:MAG: hypothetical protein IKT34_00605 [Clostridia bacterium]|nr:hypothetical protein [Clostridia bacterium]